MPPTASCLDCLALLCRPTGHLAARPPADVWQNKRRRDRDETVAEDPAEAQPDPLAAATTLYVGNLSATNAQQPAVALTGSHMLTGGELSPSLQILLHH